MTDSAQLTQLIVEIIGEFAAASIGILFIFLAVMIVFYFSVILIEQKKNQVSDAADNPPKNRKISLTDIG